MTTTTDGADGREGTGPGPHADLTLANQQLEQQNKELLALTADLEAALDEVSRSREVIRQLADFLPVCSYCRRLRDGEGAGEVWATLESYLARKTVKVTHGVCPDCFAGLVGRLE